jgi:hypothetical protein
MRKEGRKNIKDKRKEIEIIVFSWLNPNFDQLKIPSQPETCLAGSTRNSNS